MIYVLKTTVKYKKQVKIIAKEFDKITEIKKWNFDLEDCDKVLRVETNEKTLKIVCGILNSLNYICEELK